MDRVKKAFTGSFLLILLIMIASCRDPMDLLGKLEDDVKAANDLYLEVVNITPGENELNFNPGEAIRIEFDRAIDMSTFEEVFSLVNDEGIEFESGITEKSLDYSFNSDTNILTITADPYLDGLEDYKLILGDQLKGKDGSLLRESLNYSFRTSDAPRGSIQILQEYTNQGTVDIELSSQGATYYILAQTEAQLSSADWQPVTSGKMTINDVPIASVEGSNSLFVRFRDGAVNEAGSATKSNIEEATVVYDITPPNVSFGNSIVYSKNTTTAAISGNVSDSSGISSYLWEDVEAAGLSISSDTSLSTTVSKNADGSYTLRLKATDKAGNQGSGDLSYKVDSVPPVLNIASSFNTPTSTDLNLELSATDTTGIASYKWIKLTAAGSYAFSSTSVASPTLRVYSEGSYSFRVYGYDKSGNSNYKDISIVCSNSAPKVKLSSSILYRNTNDSVSAIIDSSAAYTTLWTSDDPSKVTFDSPTSDTTNVSASADGSYKITCTATSGALSSSATATFIWDNTDPSVDAGSGTLYANLSNTVPTLSGSASDGTSGSGIQTIAWSKVSGPGTVSFGSSGSTVSTVSMSTDGTYVVRLTATDKAGNTATSDRTVVRDTVAPGTPSFTATSPTSDTTPTLSITNGSPASSSYRYSKDGGSWYNYNGSYISLPYGGTSVTIQGRDIAGNLSGSSSAKTIVVFPSTYYPSSGSTYWGDLSWYPYSGALSGYYYRVYVGPTSTTVTNLLSDSYSSYPYFESAGMSRPLKDTAVYWKVAVYTRTLVLKGLYSYTQVATIPAKGSYYYVASGGLR